MSDELESRVVLIQTCGACPEQYDLKFDGVNIGYLRLRHGYFRAEYVPTGEIVYEAEPEGDGLFTSDEREGYLEAARNAILMRHFVS